MSHKNGHIGFAFSNSNIIEGLGIDIENLELIKPSIENKICNNEEISIIRAAEKKSDLSRTEILGVIFSFKESIYKCHYPIGGKKFFFHDVTITNLNLDKQNIEAKLELETSNLTPKGHIAKGDYIFKKIKNENLVISTCVEKQKEISL